MTRSSCFLEQCVPAPGWRTKRTLATVVLFLAVLPSIGASAAEATGTRIALVVGNGAYGGELGALRNPVNDARLMAQTLRGVGFAVRLVEDADEEALEDAVVAFGGDLRRSGNGGVALFYYAGHGVQSSGANYLIPVDAQVETEQHLKTRAVRATLVLEEMEEAPTALNIVVLDACRNNPFAASGRNIGGSRGLARMETPPGSFFLAYSAAAGQVAEDGDGTNSVYTGALAAAMTQPGLELEEVFKHAGRTVRDANRRLASAVAGGIVGRRVPFRFAGHQPRRSSRTRAGARHGPRGGRMALRAGLRESTDRSRFLGTPSKRPLRWSSAGASGTARCAGGNGGNAEGAVGSGGRARATIAGSADAITKSRTSPAPPRLPNVPTVYGPYRPAGRSRSDNEHRASV